jgi:hypothetical protein
MSGNLCSIFLHSFTASVRHSDNLHVRPAVNANRYSEGNLRAKQLRSSGVDISYVSSQGSRNTDNCDRLSWTSF